MDVDPLGDTLPPRHAIESDDEEDEFTPFTQNEAIKKPSPTIQVELSGSVPASEVLIIAVKDAGRRWTPGAELGTEVAQVSVNGVIVGRVFQPGWSDSVVLLSEQTARLPAWAMYEYAERVVEAISPRRIALLDTYPVPVYIDSQHTPFHEAPIRSLSTIPGNRPPNTEPFRPPNLIQSTSAAFVSIASLPSSSTTREATLILLPSPHVSPPLPSTVSAVSGASEPPWANAEDSEQQWSNALLEQAHDALFAGIADQGKSRRKWSRPDASANERGRGYRGRRGDIGEGGMYL